MRVHSTIEVEWWPMVKFRVNGTTAGPDWTGPGKANIYRSAEMSVTRPNAIR